jgi:hypothetical protein
MNLCGSNTFPMDGIILGIVLLVITGDLARAATGIDG